MKKEVENILAVGIDVAKSSMSVCLKKRDASSKALKISNTETDIKKLRNILTGFASIRLYRLANGGDHPLRISKARQSPNS